MCFVRLVLREKSVDKIIQCHKRIILNCETYSISVEINLLIDCDKFDWRAQQNKII